MQSGADLKGRGETIPSSQGFDRLPTQRVLFCTILRYPYLVMNPKNFLKAPWAAIYTNFEGRAPKKRDFLSKLSKKCIKTPFWPVFQNFASGAETLTKIGSF